MPRPLLLGASELEVVPSCRDVRGVVVDWDLGFVSEVAGLPNDEMPNV